MNWGFFAVTLLKPNEVKEQFFCITMYYFRLELTLDLNASYIEVNLLINGAWRLDHHAVVYTAN